MGSGGSTRKDKPGGENGVPASPVEVSVKPVAVRGVSSTAEPEPEAESSSPRNHVQVRSVQVEAPGSPQVCAWPDHASQPDGRSQGRPGIDNDRTDAGRNGSDQDTQRSPKTQTSSAGTREFGGSNVRSAPIGAARRDHGHVDPFNKPSVGASHLQGFGGASASQKQALRAGMAVKIVGLENATYLNGKQGVLRNWDSDLGRWVVRLTNGEEKGIRAVNVVPLQGASNAAAGANGGAVSDQANKELEGLLLQTNWSAIYQLFYQRFGIAILDKIERGMIVKAAVEMTLSIVAKCFALLRSDPGGRLHCTPLHIAALQSSVEAAEVIVRDLPKLVEQTHKPSHSALCPLHIAILCGSQAIVEMLLEGRADPNVRTLHDVCPMHLAATTSKDMVQALLSYSAEPLRRDVMGSTAVHYGASFKQQAVVELLSHSSQSSLKLVGEGDQKRVTPLHISCALFNSEEDYATPMMLLASGAKPWQADVSGAAARDCVPWSPGSPLINFFETNGDHVQVAAQSWLDQWRATKEEIPEDNEDDDPLDKVGISEEAERAADNKAGSPHFSSQDSPRGLPRNYTGTKVDEETLNLAKAAAAMEIEKSKKEHAAEVERVRQELAQSVEERARMEQSLVSQQQTAESTQALADETLAQYKKLLEDVQRTQAEERTDSEARMRSLLETARAEGREDGLKDAQEQAAIQLEETRRTCREQVEDLEVQLNEARDANMNRMDTFHEDEEASGAPDQLRATLSGFGQKLAGFGANMGGPMDEDAEEAKLKVEELSEEVMRLEELVEQEAALRGEEIKRLQEQLHQAQEENAAVKNRRAELEAELGRMRGESTSKSSEAKVMQDQVRQLQDQVRLLQEEGGGLRARRAEADARCQQLTLERQEADNRSKMREIALEKKVADSDLRGANAAEDARAEAEAARLRAEAAESESAQLQPMIERLSEQIRVLEQMFAEEQTMRKKFHNQIQDMKGAIRVFCRFRPFIKRERDGGDSVVASKADEFTAEVVQPDRDRSHQGKGAKGADSKPFSFDAVFDSGASQEEVFADCKALVQSAVDGYNVTIFAYGQTGAGKTWTMYGDAENPGLAPRSIQALFSVINKEQQKGGKTFKVKAYMIELYKQEIIDLLVAAKPQNAQFGNNAPSKGLEVRRDLGRGMMYVEGVTERDVAAPADLHQILAEGERRRHTASTQMNSASSRSHLLLSVIIECEVKEPAQVIYGKITLCDLAGSERPKKSEVSGDGLKEAIEINKSLSALGDVIEALTKGAKTIPYRNHKLTMLMQDSLGGTAKCLMFVNCSPASSNAEETTMSLKWASRARQITNDVKRNADSKEVARLKQVIAMMSQAQNATDEQDGLLGDNGGDVGMVS